MLCRMMLGRPPTQLNKISLWNDHEQTHVSEVDLEVSPPTRAALSAVSELLELLSSYQQVVLLTVIPTLDPSYAKGRYHVPLSTLGSTTEQRRQADQALQRACSRKRNVDNGIGKVREICHRSTGQV